MPLQSHEIQDFIARSGQMQDPFFDQEIDFTAVGKMTSNGPLKTDAMISFLALHWSGRIAVGAATFTLTPDSVFNLYNEIRLRGTHTRLGPWTPARVRGAQIYKLLKNGSANYAPSILGATGLGGSASTNYDIDAFLFIPVFPWGIPANMMPQYSIKGPEFPGNLKLEIDGGDGTSLGSTAANITFSAKGGSTGKPQINVYQVRPLLGKDSAGNPWQDRIVPAVPSVSYDTPDNVVQGANITNNKIFDLPTDRQISSLELLVGSAQAGLSSGLRVFGSYSDSILSNAFVSLDDHQVGNQQSIFVQKEWNALYNGRNLDTGVSFLDYVKQSANPDSAFKAIGLTAARRYSLKGTLTGGANQVMDLLEWGFVGSPSIL